MKKIMILFLLFASTVNAHPGHKHPWWDILGTIPHTALSGVPGTGACAPDNFVTSVNEGAAPTCSTVPAANETFNYMLDNRLSRCHPMSSATTWVCPGFTTTPTNTGTITNTADGNSLTFTTTASANNVAGTRYGNTTEMVTGCPYDTKFGFVVWTAASIASVKFWIVTTRSNTLADIGALSTSTTLSATLFAGIGFDTGGASDTANWHRCASDGTNMSCTDTSIAVATSSRYEIVFEQSGGSANYVVTINGTSAGTISSNLPSCGAGTFVVSVTTLAAATKSLGISTILYEVNLY